MDYLAALQQVLPVNSVILCQGGSGALWCLANVGGTNTCLQISAWSRPRLSGNLQAQKSSSKFWRLLHALHGCKSVTDPNLMLDGA